MKALLLIALCIASLPAFACNDASHQTQRKITVDMIDLNSNKLAGKVVITETEFGAVFTPDLTGLDTGAHGFHIHTNPSCHSAVINGKAVKAGAAGGHYDPYGTDKHGLPWAINSHLGDLPTLHVDIDGNIEHPVLAPRIKLHEIRNRALIIDSLGDNHSDLPTLSNADNKRVICGIIK
ncbi:superoxide dismutase family protein [Vibrio caribbeanicus]|uniref:superoxide dismutase family protein n=1 Tax=Vibrio caribbeanicus TaxID=701175 RepID=UPI0030DB2606